MNLIRSSFSLAALLVTMNCWGSEAYFSNEFNNENRDPEEPVYLRLKATKSCMYDVFKPKREFYRILQDLTASSGKAVKFELVLYRATPGALPQEQDKLDVVQKLEISPVYDREIGLPYRLLIYFDDAGGAQNGSHYRVYVAISDERGFLKFIPLNSLFTHVSIVTMCPANVRLSHGALMRIE